MQAQRWARSGQKTYLLKGLQRARARLDGSLFEFRKTVMPNIYEPWWQRLVEAGDDFFNATT